MNTPSITQAFVLGAGLGTRLRPLTEDLPKPLVPIFQKPLITFALDHLIAAGVNSFVINTHKLPEFFDQIFAGDTYLGRPATLVNEPDLLETGGGIKNAEPHFRNEPFITYSGDLLTDLPVEALVEEHFRRGNDVTLALRDTGFAASVALRDGRVVDIARRLGIAGNHDFANIAVWNPSIFSRIAAKQKISFIPVLVDWIGQGGKIGGLVINQGQWFNIGSRAEYLDVHRRIAADHWNPSYIMTPGWQGRVHPSARVDPTAELRGCSVVGKNCRVDAGAVLEDTILWPDAQIASQTRLTGCIVRSHRRVEGTHRDIDI